MSDLKKNNNLVVSSFISFFHASLWFRYLFSVSPPFLLLCPPALFFLFAASLHLLDAPLLLLLASALLALLLPPYLTLTPLLLRAEDWM